MQTARSIRRTIRRGTVPAARRRPGADARSIAAPTLLGCRRPASRRGPWCVNSSWSLLRQVQGLSAGLNVHSSRSILAAWPKNRNRLSRRPGTSTRSPARPSGLAPSRPPRSRRPWRNSGCRLAGNGRYGSDDLAARAKSPAAISSANGRITKQAGHPSALFRTSAVQNVSSCRRTGPIDGQRCSLRFGLKVTHCRHAERITPP